MQLHRQRQTEQLAASQSRRPTATPCQALQAAQRVRETQIAPLLLLQGRLKAEHQRPPPPHQHQDPQQPVQRLTLAVVKATRSQGGRGASASTWTRRAQGLPAALQPLPPLLQVVERVLTREASSALALHLVGPQTRGTLTGRPWAGQAATLRSRQALGSSPRCLDYPSRRLGLAAGQAAAAVVLGRRVQELAVQAAMRGASRP